MAKDKIRVYSTTPNSNADVDGVGILGTNKLKNADDAFRALMSHLAKMNAGTDPLADTFALGDPADITKSLRFDAGLITSGQRRVVSVPDANVTLPLRGGAAREWYYTVSGTHNFLPSSTYFQIEGIGGGGAGGNATSSISNGAAAGGGGATGVFFMSHILPITTATAAIVIGVAGQANVPILGDDGRGGSTVWNGCGFTFTAQGGQCGNSDTASTVFPKFVRGGFVPVTSDQAEIAFTAGEPGGNSTIFRLDHGFPGMGGMYKYGDSYPNGGGSFLQPLNASSPNANSHPGAGGYGATSCQTTDDANGGAGGKGLLIVREW